MTVIESSPPKPRAGNGIRPGGGPMPACSVSAPEFSGSTPPQELGFRLESDLLAQAGRVTGGRCVGGVAAGPADAPACCVYAEARPCGKRAVSYRGMARSWPVMNPTTRSSSGNRQVGVGARCGGEGPRL